jgi:lycopene cyclase domain-containing protein
VTGLYFGLLVLSIIGTVLLDYRHKLALFADARRTVLVVVLAVAFFLAWDINGVSNGVFFKGDSNLLVGWDVATEVPIEEVFFLTLLAHLALIAFRFWDRRR